MRNVVVTVLSRVRSGKVLQAFLISIFFLSSLGLAHGTIRRELIKLENKIDNYDTCGFTVNSVIKCDNRRLSGSCIASADCSAYDRTINTVGSSDNPCYPANHICKKWNGTSLNNKYVSEASGDNHFIIYYAKEYATCDDFSIINGIRYGTLFSEGSSSGNTAIATLNSKYYNLIQPPDSTNSNYLYNVFKKGTSETVDNYLTCGIANNTPIICERNRLTTSSSCTSTFTNPNKNGAAIVNCADYNEQNEYADENNNISCYPANHICNRYNENLFSKYYSIDVRNIDGTTVLGTKFYIYQKNIVGNGTNKNCELKILPCDLKLKNESVTSGELNVVYSNTQDVDNRKFIDNIFGNLNDNTYLFKYVNKCVKSACGDSIMRKSHYYKYINNALAETGNNSIVYYFIKNINNTNLGNVCNGYLPNCKDISPDNFMPTALYNNTTVESGGNNRNSRENFYTNDLKDDVKEEHLWFVDNGNFTNNNCLSIKNSGSTFDYDIGYCSDLTDNKSALKYPNGLSSTTIYDKRVPNCYLKSCMDLTQEEFNKIKNDGVSTAKYCSEFYYLESNKGFKYFPKEKPKYCSDLEMVNSTYGNQLKFRYREYNGTSEIQKINTYEIRTYQSCTPGATSCPYTVNGNKYFGYGGGLNSSGSNCYLKSCYSLNSQEREIVTHSKMVNIVEEFKRIDGTKNNEEFLPSNFNEDNLAKYCDDGFLISSKFSSNFKDINLNTIPCYKLAQKFGTIPPGRIINFEQII
ncbi:MAG: hypothetical protein LBS34_01290, partial [Rickettsiales bacterium]|nr:hypothetical protein [Rickettsiales bacterium]